MVDDKRKKTIRVSRHGLTVCPGCQRFVAIAPVAVATTCEFCGTSIRASRDDRSWMNRALLGARGSLVAVALLGASTSACLDEPSAQADADATIADTMDADGTAMDTMDVDAAPDYIVGDVYGLPPDAFDVPPDMDVVPDIPMNDVYGLPPDSFVEDATDIEIVEAPDGVISDVYGSDAGSSLPDADVSPSSDVHDDDSEQ